MTENQHEDQADDECGWTQAVEVPADPGPVSRGLRAGDVFDAETGEWLGNDIDRDNAEYDAWSNGYDDDADGM